MRSVLLFALVSSVTAFVEVQRDYHDSVGIPLAAQIKAYEDGLAEKPQYESRIVGGVLAPAGGQPYFVLNEGSNAIYIILKMDSVTLLPYFTLENEIGGGRYYWCKENFRFTQCNVIHNERKGGLLISLLTGGTSVCGSSLISSARAITAAHCWFDGVRQASMFTVILNSNFLFTGGTRIATNHIVMHPQWTTWNLNNDVAIIYLPVWLPISASIQPISIPTASEIHETFTNHWALATGFGRTHDSQPGAATILSRVNLQVISVNQCQSAFGSNFVVSSTLCTNGFGGVGICGGDSGGPLVVNYNGRQVLVGVSSFVAASGCQLGFPSAFARVTSFRNFMLQHM